MLRDDEKCVRHSATTWVRKVFPFVKVSPADFRHEKASVLGGSAVKVKSTTGPIRAPLLQGARRNAGISN
jgi:hypothetical protein